MYYEELNELVERMDVFAQRGNYEGVNMIFDRIFSSNVDDDCNYILKRVLEKALDSKADLLMQKKQNIIETADKFISKMQKKVIMTIVLYVILELHNLLPACS